MMTLHKLFDFEQIHQSKFYYSLQDKDNAQP